MSGFRQSRVAMILDVVLLPIGIVKGILVGGIHDMYRELVEMPSRFRSNWRVAGWFGGSSSTHSTPGYSDQDELYPEYEAVCHHCGKTTSWLDAREYGDVVGCIHCGHEIELPQKEDVRN
jgi:DNA-directed RNA polymerase subunit RPC12/RpoP